MLKYIGTKLVNAKPMTLGEYNKFRMWELSLDEDPLTPGYLIEYLDSKEANTYAYEGYVSWSPKEEFEKAYKAIEGEHQNLTFGDVLHMLKQGKRVARVGWNGKDMFLFLVPGSQFKVNRPPLLGIFPEGTEVDYHAHIDIKTATGEIVPWVASQTDVLAEDWVVLN